VVMFWLYMQGILVLRGGVCGRALSKHRDPRS
jgi:hypothetical protein